MHSTRFVVFILLVLSLTTTYGQMDTTLTLHESTNVAAAVSPDGREIAFDALGRIWVMPATGGEAEALTDAFGNARQPCWSSDGNLIAFQGYWDGNWHIYTIQRNGENLTQRTQGPYDHREPHWAPFASQLVFSSDRSGSYDIWQLNTTDKELSQLTDDPANEFGPAWSPDGTRIAFVSDQPDAKGIYLWYAASSSTDLLHRSDEQIDGVAWHPDGEELTFVQQGRIGSMLRSYSFEEELSSIASGFRDVFPFRASWASIDEFIYTADGKIHRQQRSSPRSSVVPMSYKVTLSRPEYDFKERSYESETDLQIKGIMHPKLAPDGKSLVAIMLGDIWQIGMDGRCQQLTNDDAIEMSPIWSPDGKSIAYLSDRSGDLRLWIRDLTSGTETAHGTLVGSVAGIAWSPTRPELAISSNFGPRVGRISRYDLRTDSTISVGPIISSSIGAPTWSSDGETIAVTALAPYSTRFREGINRVLYYRRDGAAAGHLASLPHMSMGVRVQDGPVWSPSGSQLATISSGKLWMIPLDDTYQLAGDPKLLYQGLADSPSWSSDGNLLLFQATDQLMLLDISTGTARKIELQKSWNRVNPTESYIIHAGTLFNGKDRTFQFDVDVHIDGHRIGMIEPHRDRSNEDIRVVDASDQFVMPGLIDGHAHQGSWEGKKLDKAWLSWGVTSTRDPASDPYDALNRREARESGHHVGPRIFFTGSPFDGNRIYYAGASALADPEQIKDELARADRLDFDMIKTYVRLADPLQKEIIEEAHKIGIPVSSHELYPAVAYGIDGIEHVSGTSRRGYSAKFSSQNLAYDDVIQLIAASGMTFTPTTGIYIAYNYLLSRNDDVLDDPRVRAFVPTSGVERTRAGLQEYRDNAEVYSQTFANTMKMVRQVHDQGGLLTAGTDSPIIPYGLGLHLELESYRRAGLDAIDVLMSCTSNAAKLLHAEQELGSIEEGKLADLIILHENPVDDIRHARSLDKVIANGRLYTLKELLEGQE